MTVIIKTLITNQLYYLHQEQSKTEEQKDVSSFESVQRDYLMCTRKNEIHIHFA